MKAILTGMNGTIAPSLARRLREHGHAVVAWDRSRVPPDDPLACRGFLLQVAPDACFHLATGSPDWVETLAGLCSELQIRFLFTSSVSVFSDRQQGPFAVDATPDATDDYGRYKIECERRVRSANAAALIARLGWQIGDAPGSNTPGWNTMVDHLCQRMERDGRIEASVHWLPACAFLGDTAEVLHRLMEDFPAGTYHIDGNPGMSFYEIVRALDRVQGRSWKIVPSTTPVLDMRMVDQRLSVTPITARFGV
jgi:dTDP-4-dehydrorhamnose reductase